MGGKVVFPFHEAYLILRNSAGHVYIPIYIKAWDPWGIRVRSLVGFLTGILETESAHIEEVKILGKLPGLHIFSENFFKVSLFVLVDVVIVLVCLDR